MQEISVPQNATTLAEKKYDSKYDIIKFVLSLMVLAIHSGLFPMALYPWLRIAVPLFFIMSSKFVFSKLHNAPKERHFSILKGFVIRNLQLYLCWFIILLPITLYSRWDIYFGSTFWLNTLTIIRSIIFQSSFIASWFIMATIIGVLIIYFLNKLLRKNNCVLFVISIFVFSIVSIASSYKFAIEDTFLLTAINWYTYIFGGLVLSFPAAIFWVFIGKLLAEGKLKLKSTALSIIFAVLSAVGLYIEWRYVISATSSFNNDSYFMLAPLCVSLFLCIEKIKPFQWKHSIRFKRMSTVIYVLHGSLEAAFSKILLILFDFSSPVVSFIITLICCIIAYICIELIIKLLGKYRIVKIPKMLY